MRKKGFLVMLIFSVTVEFFHAQAQTIKSKLSIHTSFANNGYYSWRFVREAKPRLIKLFDEFKMAQQIKDIVPGIIIVGRIYEGSYPTLEGDPVQRAREWWNIQGPIINSYPAVDYWEGYNEPGYLKPGGQMEWYAQFEAERVRILAAYGKKACIGNFATGNIHTPKLDGGASWDAFAPALDAAKEHNGILGLHEYGCPMQCAFGVDCPPDEGWLCGRYRQFYRHYFIPKDKVLPLVITECGVDNVSNVPGCCGYSGWRSGYTWEQYRDQLKWYDDILKEDWYVIGATIFCLETSGIGWRNFEIDDPELMSWLISHVAAGTADNLPPPSPTLISPENGATLTSFPITFKWSAVNDDNTGGSNPCSYEIQIDDDSEFSSPNIQEIGLYSSQYSLSSIANGTYWWRVRAKDSAGNSSNWSEKRSITVNYIPPQDTTPPPTPSLFSPQENATITSIPATFDWGDVDDSATGGSNPCTYEFELNADRSFASSPYISASELSTSQYILYSFLPNGKYWWRVRVKDKAGNRSNWTEPRSVVIELPTSETLIQIENRGFELGLTSWNTHYLSLATYSIDTSVAHSGKKSAKISCNTYEEAHFWQATPEDSIRGGQRYKCWVWVKTQDVVKGSGISYGTALRLQWADNSFQTISREDWIPGPTGSSNWVKISTTVIAPVWAQRVQVALFLHNAVGTVWFDDVNTESEIIIDNSSPTVPALLSPANDAVVTSYPIIFDWTDAIDKESINIYYDFQLDDDPNFAPPVLIERENLSASQYIQNYSLSLAKGRYWWRVRAKDDAGNTSLWSSTSSIVVNITSEEEKTLIVKPNVLEKTTAKKINLEYKVHTPGEVYIRIYSLDGMLVKEIFKYYRNGGIVDKEAIEMQDENGVELPSGIYLIHYTNGDKNEVEKIIYIR